MKKALVKISGTEAGILAEHDDGSYSFGYFPEYNGMPVSQTMPVHERSFVFKNFPPFFDGLLPEGIMLESLLKINKIDKNDFFSQLIAVGEDLVGAVTVEIYEE